MPRGDRERNRGVDLRARIVGARYSQPRAEQAILFNIVTLITVSFGILALYAGACLISLAAAELMLQPSLMSAQIGHRSDFADAASEQRQAQVVRKVRNR